MGHAFGWTVAVFAGLWLFLAARGIARAFKQSRSIQWVTGTMGVLILIGAGGFFGAALSALGVLKFPSSFEWPAGYASGVVKTADGGYIVPLPPSGRVQIYDSNWHFIRGWHVDAEGGDFRVECSPTGLVEVLTARGQHHYSFAASGELVSTATLTEPFYSLPKSGQSFVVPTSPLLWVFSSPFLSMAPVVIGFAGLAFVKRLAPNKPRDR